MRHVAEVIHLPQLQPATYLIAGSIDALDTKSHRVRLASRDLAVIDGVRLDGFRVGDRVVAHTARDFATGRMHVIGMVSDRVLNTRAGRGVVRRILDTAVRVTRTQRIVRASRS